jgi:hypothetical protein
MRMPATANAAVQARMTGPRAGVTISPRPVPGHAMRANRAVPMTRKIVRPGS